MLACTQFRQHSRVAKGCVHHVLVLLRQLLQALQVGGGLRGWAGCIRQAVALGTGRPPPGWAGDVGAAQNTSLMRTSILVTTRAVTHSQWRPACGESGPGGVLQAQGWLQRRGGCAWLWVHGWSSGDVGQDDGVSTHTSTSRGSLGA